MERKKVMLGRLSLLLATVIWGSSYVVLKDTAGVLPAMFIYAVRFLAAGAVLTVIFWKKIRAAKWDFGYIAAGGAVGLCTLAAYYVQTVGLRDTTPGKSAFLTAVFCVIVPFLHWAADKKRPDWYNIIAAVLCFAGIGLVSLKADFTVERGDGITLISGLLCAVHIILVGKLSGKRDPVLLTVVQFFVAGSCALVCHLLFEEPAAAAMVQAAAPQLLYLAVFCTAVTLLCQNWGQAVVPPANAAILLSLESVFAVVFSVVLQQEVLTLRLFNGFTLIFMAVILSETKLSFFKPAVRAGKHG